MINRGQIVRQSSTLGLVEFMLQEFDLAARWTSMIQILPESVHNLAQKWPDEQSLEVSYRLIEGSTTNSHRT